jgi:GTP:adenosylcobinamide-phosphate guanylyltransferase
MNAVITAGGRVDGEYAREAGTTIKALARVRGVSMLERAIGAARGAGATHITVVGGSEVRAACVPGVESIIDESDDGSENMLRALQAGGNGALLYLTSDLPFITAGALQSFVGAVPPGTLGMPIASIAAFERRFPAAPPFGITLGRERVVNGGVFVLPPGGAARLTELAPAFFAARKSPWAMAGLLGPSLLLRFALRRLGVAELEAQARDRLGFPARAIRDCSPELCYDADKVQEYRYACGQS